MNKKLKSALCVLAAAAVLSTSGSVLVQASAAEEQPRVAADWRFEQSSIVSGSLATGDLTLRDSSGNGNTIELQTYNGETDVTPYMSFSEDKMYDGTSGSLEWTDRTHGGDFITVSDAPINRENFENGYTIEFVYKLPADFTTSDAWMGLLARQGDCTSMDEKELGTMSVAISNCKELQYTTANKQDSHKMSSAAWSVSMDEGGVWYHIAIVSDNHVIKTYINGCEAFRDYVSDEMTGMYADPADGRFRIGSSYWDGVLSKFGRGNYQQVRITDGALEKSDWIIPNPEQYLGDYGSNRDFSITAGGNYNMVFIPDTQNTVKFKGNVIDTAMDWLVDNKDRTNLAAVVSLGDIVENWYDQTQWDTAKGIFTKLPQAGIQFLEQPGNHDYGGSYYLDNFGPNSDFGGMVQQNGTQYSPSGYSSYITYEAGSYTYLAVNLSMNHVTDLNEIAWFENVLSTHQNYPTIVTSHDVQNCSDASPSDIRLSSNGQKIWNIVKRYNQVFFLIGGHSHGAGEEILVNDAGNQVISVLADYQFAYNGGNAFLKFAEFDEAHNKINLSTFSPYAYTLPLEDKTFFDVNYMTGPGNYTEFDFDFAARFAGAQPSAAAEAQQEILHIVRGIDALPETVTLADKETVLDLAERFAALPEDAKADFANADKLAAAVATIEALEKVDKTILDRVIDYAQGLVDDGQLDTLIPSVQQSFQQAFDNAKQVSANASATQQQVDDAWMQLMTEIHKFGFVAGDKTQISLLLAQAESIGSRLDSYVEAGKQEFSAAQQAAAAVNSDPDAMASDIQPVADRLLDAMLNLRLKADKTLLASAVSEARALDLSGYTLQSVEAFHSAVAEAEQLLADNALSVDDQDRVDAATEAISAAKAALVPISSSSSKTPETTLTFNYTGDTAATSSSSSPRTGDSAAVPLAVLAGLAALVVAAHRKNSLSK